MRSSVGLSHQLLRSGCRRSRPRSLSWKSSSGMRLYPPSLGAYPAVSCSVSFAFDGGDKIRGEKVYEYPELGGRATTANGRRALKCFTFELSFAAELCHDIATRSWTIMNQFFEYLKLGSQPLSKTEFPLL